MNINDTNTVYSPYSGGTTCVWAPVRETNFGPRKMMTYVGRSGGILRQKIFEFRVSEWHFLHFESTYE